MTKFRLIYQLSFYLLSIIIFILGGLSQFLLGISNTVMTFLLMSWLLVTYFVYSLLKGKVVLNKFVLVSTLYVIAIVVSAVINKSSVISTLVYLIFPLLPLSVYLYAYINFRERFLSFEKVFKLFLGIGLLQLPILLIQQNFYNFLIGFNRSGQTIDPLDFMFGTFFIKSDHSLGAFLLLLIATILYKKKRVATIVTTPNLTVFYLLLTLFLTQSNISKLLGTLLILTTLLVPIYRKYGQRIVFKVAILMFGASIVIAGYGLKDETFIQTRLGGPLEEQFSLDRAERYYELGTAKRFQIVMVALGRLKLKWSGDGPYSYFDIRSGKFTKAPHFSQLLWTYFDLGILGLFIALLYLSAISKALFLKRGVISFFFFGVLLIYSFYTILFSDIAILFGLFSIFNNERRNQHATGM